ncbi:collagen alpha-1(I) chain-like [Cervus canadensis]|uniref:collagen alpha-1(I) chain-like n=1 Tax=Cervus canadensis TaxID=1574408 RepID=UPI001CA33008|nr:collagen alpha-1(I) chain-like [Cervus canadensis]
MAVLSSWTRFPWWLTRAADTVVKGQNRQLGTQGGAQLGGGATLVPRPPWARTVPPRGYWPGVPLTFDRTRLPGLKQRDSRTSEGNQGRLGSDASPTLPRPGEGLNRHTLRGKPPQKPSQRQRSPPPAPRPAGREPRAAGAPLPPGAGGRSRGWRDRPGLRRSIFRLLAQGSVDEAGAGGKPGGDRASSRRAGASSGSCASPGTSRVKCVRGAERESQTAGTGDFPAEGEAASRGSAGHPAASAGTWARGVGRTRRQPPAGHAADAPRPPPGPTISSEPGTWDLCRDRVGWRPREKSRVEPKRRVDRTALEQRYRPVTRDRKVVSVERCPNSGHVCVRVGGWLSVSTWQVLGIELVCVLGSGLCPHRQGLRAEPVSERRSVGHRSWFSVRAELMSALGLGWLWMKRHDPGVWVALTVDRGQDACLV